jgi:hypothetical protein
MQSGIGGGGPSTTDSSPAVTAGFRKFTLIADNVRMLLLKDFRKDQLTAFLQASNALVLMRNIK